MVFNGAKYNSEDSLFVKIQVGFTVGGVKEDGVGRLLVGGILVTITICRYCEVGGTHSIFGYEIIDSTIVMTTGGKITMWKPLRIFFKTSI